MGEVDVKSELRWWYNGVYVTDYGEGVCGSWAGKCWNLSGPLSCYWDTSNMPYEIDVLSQQSYSVNWSCWAFCPNCGGWARVDTSGSGMGTHGTFCQHDFTGPPPTTWSCYHVHL